MSHYTEQSTELWVDNSLSQHVQAEVNKKHPLDSVIKCNGPEINCSDCKPDSSAPPPQERDTVTNTSGTAVAFS